MKKLKVMTLVGTRPEIIKLSRVIARLDADAEHVLVHSGQNYDYELSQVFFDDLRIRRPDHFLEASGTSSAETIGKVIIAADQVLSVVKPDAVLFLGDTNSCLACIAAKKHKIPIFHMEAGNRCFDQRVPEEVNRKIVDHVSDINLPYTEHARRYLLAEGLPADRIIKTGSPMKEVIEYNRSAIAASGVLQNLDLEAGNYLLVSSHREENVDDPNRLLQLMDCLDRLADDFKLPVLVSTHPRTRKRIEDLPQGRMSKLVRFNKPFGFHDYIHLQMNAYCVLSDSGTLTEEAALLGFPSVMLREAHERPEGMDEAVTIMAEFHPEKLAAAVELAVRHHQERDTIPVRLPADYDVDNLSLKVVRIIYGYTDYVRRNVWRRVGAG